MTKTVAELSAIYAKYGVGSHGDALLAIYQAGVDDAKAGQRAAFNEALADARSNSERGDAHAVTGATCVSGVFNISAGGADWGTGSCGVITGGGGAGGNGRGPVSGVGGYQAQLIRTGDENG